MPAASSVSDPFLDARRVFDEVVQKLSGTEVSAMAHGEVEALVSREGRELLRQLLAGHLSLRSQRERREPMRGADQELRKYARKSDRALGSLFGEIELQRIELRMHGLSGGLRPLDAELNLPPELHSHGVQRMVSWLAAGEAFDTVVTTMEVTTGLMLGKRQVEEMATRAAVDFDAFYARGTSDPVVGAELLVLSFDGKGVVMRPEGLREATRKASEREGALKHRLSPGEKNGRKRMAEVATVYDLEARPRTTADLVAELDGGPATRPRPLNKRVWASLEKDPADVIAEGFREARSRDPDRKRTWVVLVDGHRDQLRLIREEARRARQKVVVVLDVIHVLEYLWKAAWALFPKADPQAERWVTERLTRLLDGEVSSVAAGIRRSATKREMKPEERAPMDSCANYLLNHKKLLRYDLFLESGYPIATGVIEGACRHLIQDRMDITGARWGLERAEAILKLRSLRSSGDFEAYWDFHVARELERNHLRHYADTELPHLRGAA